MSAKPEESIDETDSAPPAEGGEKDGKEGDVREHMVGILFSKGNLSGLQKQVREGGREGASCAGNKHLKYFSILSMHEVFHSPWRCLQTHPHISATRSAEPQQVSMLFCPP